MIRTCFVLLIIGAPTAVSWAGDNMSFRVDSAKSLIQFRSEAPLEHFVGKTKQVTGRFQWDSKDLFKAVGDVSVDAESLKTGNRLRDKDMDRKFLETERYPKISFTFERVLSGPRELEPGKKVELMIEGIFDLHGAQRMEQFPVTVEFSSEQQTLSVTSQFPIKLSDYNIERPKFLWMRLADEVQVSVDLVSVP